MSSLERRSRRQLWWSLSAAAAVVVSVIAVPAGGGSSRVTLAEANEAAKADRAAPARPHVDPAGTPPHDHDDPAGAAPHVHDDPATKNAVSRAAETGKATQDPTTAAERRAGAAYVARERALPDPRLTTVPATSSRARYPETRYAMANGCYTLATGRGRYVTRSGTTVAVARVSRSPEKALPPSARSAGRAGRNSTQGNL